jgi:Tol biopolymer transport system component
MQADGSDLSKLLETSRDELFPDLVRGTRGKVAYAAEDGTGWDIWTLTVVGENNAQLTTQSPSNQIQPSWSYNASKIAYASNYGEGQTPPLSTTWEIYTMTATGGSQTQLTTQSPSWAIAPAYSPVNDDIAFVSDKNATGNRSSIWLWDDSASTASEIYDSDGRDGDASPNLTGLQTALNLPTDAGISKPAWKPDGAKIAFSRERTVGGIIDIYVIDSDGTDAETLEEYVEGLTGTTFSDTITTDKDEFCPYWLEDNSGLVFVREETAGNFNIYKVSFSTGAVTQLTSSAAPDNNVSPTSKKR